MDQQTIWPTENRVGDLPVESQPTATRSIIAALLESDVGDSASSSRTDGGSATLTSSSDSTTSLMHLRLMRMPSVQRVTFHEGVVDNEGMNRRKSKCCCIYRKPHAFDQSSSSSDDECEHCFGHPEVRRRNRVQQQQQQQPPQQQQPQQQ